MGVCEYWVPWVKWDRGRCLCMGEGGLGMGV